MEDVDAPDQPESEAVPEDEIVIEEEPLTLEPARQTPVADEVMEEIDEIGAEMAPESTKVMLADVPRHDAGPDEPTIEDKARAAL